jgi:hypothetical protein
MSSKTVTIEPLTVSVTEAAAMSDLSIRAIWKAIKEDKLKAVRVGKRTLVPVQNLRSFLPKSKSIRESSLLSHWFVS